MTSNAVERKAKTRIRWVELNKMVLDLNLIKYFLLDMSATITRMNVLSHYSLLTPLSVYYVSGYAFSAVT